MTSELLGRAARLSDRDLVARVSCLAGRERASTVELVAHLGELEARKLHVAEGHGSLFGYCTRVLRLAEHAAYNRIEAARLCRRFPRLLDLLADGALSLSTLRLLGPHLEADTVESLARAASGRSKREVEALVASLAPRPDTRASVRRLPAVGAGTGPASTAGFVASAPEPAGAGQASSVSDRPQLSGGSHRDPPRRVGASLSRLSDRPQVAALAPQRFRVQFTIGSTTHDKLRQAQDLLRREIPDGDPGTIFDRALTLLLEDVARRKLALVERPSPRGRGSKPQRTGSGRGSRRGRHIPAHVKRAVWLRDGARCAFVTAGGRRCPERAFLEFHHCDPHAVGGEASIRNISLRCRAHNVYEAELFFGPGVGARRSPKPDHPDRARCGPPPSDAATVGSRAVAGAPGRPG